MLQSEPSRRRPQAFYPMQVKSRCRGLNGDPDCISNFGMEMAARTYGLVRDRRARSPSLTMNTVLQVLTRVLQTGDEGEGEVGGGNG